MLLGSAYGARRAIPGLRLVAYPIRVVRLVHFSAKEVALGRQNELPSRSVAPWRVAADHGRGDALRLAHDQLGRSRELVGDRDLGRAELVAGGVTGSAQIEERRHP